MFKRRAVAVALTAAAACSAPTASLPAPVFTRTLGLPGFVIECRNSTDRPITRIENSITALRLDGEIIQSRGGIGSVLGGLPPDVPPGQKWNYVVVLHPNKVVRTSSGVGLETGTLKKDWAVPLKKGRHTVAFQCAGDWTADASFEW